MWSPNITCILTSQHNGPFQMNPGTRRKIHKPIAAQSQRRNWGEIIRCHPNQSHHHSNGHLGAFLAMAAWGKPWTGCTPYPMNIGDIGKEKCTHTNLIIYQDPSTPRPWGELESMPLRNTKINSPATCSPPAPSPFKEDDKNMLLSDFIKKMSSLQNFLTLSTSRPRQNWTMRQGFESINRNSMWGKSWHPPPFTFTFTYLLLILAIVIPHISVDHSHQPVIYDWGFWPKSNFKCRGGGELWECFQTRGWSSSN